MRCATTPGIPVLLLLALGSLHARANPQGFGPAARLSAAVGGSLDSDLGEAGCLAHEIDYSLIRLMPGRSVEYRRRVALEMQLAAGSRDPAARAAVLIGRTAD
jgi:hypothetical protein